MKDFIKYKAIITLECEATLESKYNINEIEDYFKKIFKIAEDQNITEIKIEVMGNLGGEI